MPDFALAAMLLLSPHGTIEAPPPADRWPALSLAIQGVAMEWELLDVAETKYIGRDLKDFQVDLDIIRARREEYGGTPRVDERRRFPDRSACREAIEFNRAYCDYLETLKPLNWEQAAEIQDALSETHRLYQVWDALRDAQCDYYHVTVRRIALEKVRKYVGDELFRAGGMPPCVPEWRFREDRR